MTKTFLRLVLVAGCLLAPAAATPAVAQSPTEDAYGGIAPRSGSGGPSTTTTTTTTTTTAGGDQTLPFTGLDYGLFAFSGLALVGTGLVLRRTLRSQQG